MPVPWLWEDQISWLTFARDSSWQRFVRARAQIAAGGEPLWQKAYWGYAESFRTMAIAAFALDEDIRQCMVYLHVSGEFGEKLLAMDEDSSQGAWPAMNAIWSALASGDMELARRIAVSSGRDSDFRLYSPVESWYLRLLKHSVLGDEEEASMCIGKMEQAKDRLDELRLPFKKMGQLCYAIFSRDSGNAQACLDSYLESFHRLAKPRLREMAPGEKRRLVRDIDDLLCTHGLAMCRFGKALGVKLEVHDQYVPMALLEEPPVLDSHSDEYVQKALSEQPGESEQVEHRKSFFSRFFR